MDEIRTALVGLGPRGVRTWLPLLERIDGYRIVAVCDPIVERHEAALTRLGHRQGVRAYRELDDVLGDPDVDAVALTVRCEDQGALAARALRAGKHVHAEVPAAHSIEDCWELVLAVEETGLVYQLGEQTRHWGFVDAWRSLVAEGRLGDVTLCEGQYFHHTADVLRSSWAQHMPSIHYLPHELSPMLKVLDDRVVQVVAMGTSGPSRGTPGIAQPDMQVALMKTRKGAVLRMAASFAQPHPSTNWHWYQVLGTRGRVEWKRADRDLPRLWLSGCGMRDLAEVDWRTEPLDASAEERESGHGGADYRPHVIFRDAVHGVRAPELDVYGAVDTAAPAVLAAESIERGSVPFEVPDFRPGPGRAALARPSERP